mmetsp:Transcript_52137/g.151511  ORF Transcript_52137/g.151511 Transcript_52137/m.151511 type:complete len:298 (+) Transcript_52137:881-1774(+)
MCISLLTAERLWPQQSLACGAPRGAPRGQLPQHTEADILAARERRPWALFELLPAGDGHSDEEPIVQQLSPDTWLSAVQESRRVIFSRIWPGQRAETLQAERLMALHSMKRGGFPRIQDVYIVEVEFSGQRLVKAGVSVDGWLRSRGQGKQEDVVALWRTAFVAPSLANDMYRSSTSVGDSDDTTPETEWRRLMGPAWGPGRTRETWSIDRKAELLAKVAWTLATSRMSSRKGQSPESIIEEGTAAAKELSAQPPAAKRRKLTKKPAAATDAPTPEYLRLTIHPRGMPKDEQMSQGY